MRLEPISSVVRAHFECGSSPFRVWFEPISSVVGAHFECGSSPFRVWFEPISSVVRAHIECGSSPFRVWFEPISSVVRAHFECGSSPFRVWFEPISSRDVPVSGRISYWYPAGYRIIALLAVTSSSRIVVLGEDHDDVTSNYELL